MKKALILFFIFLKIFSLYSFDIASENSLNSLIEAEARFSTGGRIFKPVSSEDTGQLYLFSEDSRFYIFKNTELVKKIKLISQPLFPPAEGRDGTLYCCFKDRTIRAYNRGGMHLWIKKLPATPVLPPVVNSHGNVVLFLSDSSAVSYALNGRMRWRKDVDVFPGIMPVSFSRGIIFNTSDSYKFLTDRGKTVNIGEYCNAAGFLHSGGNLFLCRRTDSRFRIESDSDNAVKDNSLESSEQLKPGSNALDNSVLKQSAGNAAENYTSSDAENQNHIEDTGNADSWGNNSSYESVDYIISSLDNRFNVKWSVPVKGRPSEIKKYGSNFYILTDRGYFYKTDINGSVLKHQKAASGVNSNIIILDNYIYLLSSAGYIKLYSHDLVFKDRIAVPEKAVSGMSTSSSSADDYPEPVFTGDGRIVLGGSDWIVYFFKAGDSGSNILKDDFPEPVEITDYDFTDTLYYIQELSKSESYENRLKALDLLGEMINKGAYSRYEYEILDILFRIGTEGTVNRSRGDQSGNRGAVIRSSASELIFSAGTHNSLSMIRKMINAENDEYVIIKNIYLLGMGGSDPGHATFKVFKRVLEKSKYDIRVCSAVVSAAGNIASYNGYLPAHYSGMLLGIMEMQSDKNLKNKIIKLLVEKQYQERGK